MALGFPIFLSRCYHLGRNMAETRVLLVNPNQMKPAVAPLAVDYLASALEEQGFAVDVLDLCFSEDISRDIARYFTEREVAAVGVTFRNTDDTYFASQDFFVPRLKQITDCLRAHTSAPIILGGAGFSIMPEAILGYCDLELGIWGEGEYSLPLLVSRLVQHQSHRDIPGLVYRQDRDFRRNPPRYLDLRQMTAPRRHFVDNPRYFKEGAMGNLETKRGCPQPCIYCGDPLGKGSKLRLRSPSSVAQEMAALLEQGIDHFHLCDSEFNIPQAHAREVCLELIARGLGERARWYAYASPVPFSDELASLFKKAGCVGIDFGVDAGCDSMLRALGRDFTVADLESTAQICHRQGIIFMYDLLLGAPGETRDTLRETAETMKRLSPHRVGVSLGVRVLPGTRLASLVKSQGAMASNPNLHGAKSNNDSFLAPVFYLSAETGGDAPAYLSRLIGGDQRFFFGSREAVDQNYNYNENTVLVRAIKAGYRGAFWDILRRVQERQ